MKTYVLRLMNLSNDFGINFDSFTTSTFFRYTTSSYHCNCKRSSLGLCPNSDLTWISLQVNFCITGRKFSVGGYAILVQRYPGLLRSFYKQRSPLIETAKRWWPILEFSPLSVPSSVEKENLLTYV